MPDLTVATPVMFASLGLVGLSLGLLARRYSRRVLAIGLAGLFGLAAATTWIALARLDHVPPHDDGTPTPPIAPAGTAGAGSEPRTATNPLLSPGQGPDTAEQEAGEFGQRVAELTQQVADLKRRFGEEEKNRFRAESDIGAARSQAQALERQKLEVEGQRQTAEDLLRQERDKHAATAVTLASTNRQIAARDAENRALVAELERLRGQRTFEPRLLRAALDQGLETDCYLAQPGRERVVGLAGSWYVLRLKSGGVPLRFDDGRFKIADNDLNKVRDCAGRLRDDIVERVARAAKGTRLFVRGEADARDIDGLVVQPESREFDVLPRRRDGSYVLEPQPQTVARPIRNEDLPVLRADWLRRLIEPVPRAGAATDIGILANAPGRGHERTAQFLLFADW